jgi:hypothetical protein
MNTNILNQTTMNVDVNSIVQGFLTEIAAQREHYEKIIAVQRAHYERLITEIAKSKAKQQSTDFMSAMNRKTHITA